MSDPTPTAPESARGLTPEDAARELLATLGMKDPSCWAFKAVGEALCEAEERGAARERARCAEVAEEHASGYCAYLARRIAEAIRVGSEAKGSKK